VPIEYPVYVCVYPYWHTPNACCDLLGGFPLFTEQPAPPHIVVSTQPQVVEVVAQKQAIPASNPAAIASPEVLSPQSAGSVPAPEPSPTPSRVEPMPAPSPSPLRVEPVQSAPQVQASPVPLSPVGQRRQEIEQHLAEIVSKQRADQKAQQQQKAEIEAAKYAGAGEFERAKQAVSKPSLPRDVQAAILKRLAAQQAKAGKTGTIAKETTKQNAPIPNGLSIAESANGTAPSYSPPAGIGATPGSYSTQPILPNAQPLLQLPAGLIGKNLSLIYPLAVQAPVTSVFGWRVHPITGTPRFHRGLDLGAPYGSPVIAAKAGRVETADFLDGYGLTIVLRHNDTQQTLYAHLSEVLVKPGDWVKQGGLVGQVGSTGNSTGPHLHFEFLQMTSQGWMALDPAALLNQAIATARNVPVVKTGTGQLLRLSASGTLDINAIASNSGTPIANSMIPGYSLLADLINSPSPDDQDGVFFPFAMLPSAVPELNWLLSPFVSTFLAEQPNPLASFLGLSNLPPNVLPPTVNFQPLPAIASASATASRQPKQLAAVLLPGQASAQYSISRSTVLQTALQPQAQPTASPPSPGLTATAPNKLTAFQSNLNGKLPNSSNNTTELSLVQIRSQQLPKASLERLSELNQAIDRQSQSKKISDARVQR
jgi:murein DD-endopeptidase MepM/ murein hydrolase activator NlpD